MKRKRCFSISILKYSFSQKRLMKKKSLPDKKRSLHEQMSFLSKALWRSNVKHICDYYLLQSPQNFQKPVISLRYRNIIQHLNPIYLAQRDICSDVYFSLHTVNCQSQICCKFPISFPYIQLICPIRGDLSILISMAALDLRTLWDTADVW